MENNTSAADVVSTCISCAVPVSCQQTESHHNEEYRMQQVRPLSIFALHESSAAEDESRSPALPTALLSRHRRQDRSIIRLHAVLLTCSSGSSACDALQKQLKQDALSPKTTNPGLSPKNSLSLGYDDDAFSSVSSTPRVESSPFLKAVTTDVPLTQSSESSSISKGVKDSREVRFVEGLGVEDDTVVNSEWQHEANSGSVTAEKGWRMEKEDHVVRAQESSFYDFDSYLFLHQSCSETATSCNRSNISSPGLLGTTLAGIDVHDTDDVVKETGNSSPKDSDNNIGDHNDDNSDEDENEVIGVTEEGDFIYRRDVAGNVERQRWGCHQKNHGRCTIACEGYHMDNDVVPTAFSLPVVDQHICTLKRSIVRTALDSKMHLPLFSSPSRHLHSRSPLEDAATAPSVIPPSPFASFSKARAEPSIQRVGCYSSVEPPMWTAQDLEWCSLFLRHCVRENADDLEYHDLVNAVDEWHDAQRRYPVEALESRLQEEQECNPSFILRW